MADFSTVSRGGEAARAGPGQDARALETSSFVSTVAAVAESASVGAAFPARTQPFCSPSFFFFVHLPPTPPPRSYGPESVDAIHTRCPPPSLTPTMLMGRLP